MLKSRMIRIEKAYRSRLWYLGYVLRDLKPNGNGMVRLNKLSVPIAQSGLCFVLFKRENNRQQSMEFYATVVS